MDPACQELRQAHEGVGREGGSERVVRRARPRLPICLERERYPGSERLLGDGRGDGMVKVGGHQVLETCRKGTCGRSEMEGQVRQVVQR